MSNKFMPKKPTIKDFSEFTEHSKNISILHDFADFIDQYWNEHIEPMFKDAKVIYGFRSGEGTGSFSEGLDENSEATHKAILINIRAIEQPKTDSEKLKAILDAYEKYSNEGLIQGASDVFQAIKKARKS